MILIKSGIPLGDPLEILSDAQCVVWDFDGVIKESVSVKTNAFYVLFLPYGEELAARICAHHLQHSGVSRYEKLKLYLHWSGFRVTSALIDQFADMFAEKVVTSVIRSDWTPGVLDYIHQNWRNKKFIICSATPQGELQYICEEINISRMFHALIGSPTSKSEGIENFLSVNPSLITSTVMIGDAVADIEAARASNVGFILRCHSQKSGCQRNVAGAKD